MKVINGQTFLTPKEVAQLLGISSKTVHAWSADGKTHDHRPASAPDLKPYRGPTRRLYFPQDHILQLSHEFFGMPSTQPPQPAQPATELELSGSTH